MEPNREVGGLGTAGKMESRVFLRKRFDNKDSLVALGVEPASLRDDQ